ncbi:MAG: hypothetical protein ACE5JI_19570, partial [Acidobacteriota bacterium]
MDGILSYHMNPLTCGVAKFNTMLSRRLRVPLLHLFDPAARDFSRPLLSFKISEFRRQDVPRLERLLRTARWRDAFRLFLHEWGGSEVERRLVGSAAFVFCGNSELMAQLGHLRSGLAEVWCPGTLVDAQPFERCEISVFSFGMAHKLRVDHYRRL